MTDLIPGSSPHTRGARWHAALLSEPVRIIPAYAGSTAAERYLFGAIGDHPRIRGEHDLAVFLDHTRAGSSPHTRGAPDLLRDSGYEAGIIPAYAGSTMVVVSSTGRRRDHPRIRGEHDASLAGQDEQEGSSPHTRGARQRSAHAGDDHGIIPAYAGSTKEHSKTPGSLSDHPRIRGEHSTRWSSPSSNLGSSPHTRGARRPGSRSHSRERIIPAYAGSTCVGSLANSDGMDHPRIRGEHGRHRRQVPRPRGSSPHTRGAHRRHG